MDYHNCPLRNQIIEDELCYETVMAVNGLNAESFRIKLEKEYPKCKEICSDCEYNQEKSLKDKILNIDSTIDILCNGEKEQIKKVIQDNKISYSFGNSGEYTIIIDKFDQGIRGQGIFNPNCAKYFGNKYSYKEEG